MITGIGGNGKIIGGGNGIGISTCTLTPAFAENGAITTNVKINILKIVFFIGFPPYLIFLKLLLGNLRATNGKHEKMSMLSSN
jgi:hypothetical protein